MEQMSALAGQALLTGNGNVDQGLTFPGSNFGTHAIMCITVFFDNPSTCSQTYCRFWAGTGK